MENTTNFGGDVIDEATLISLEQTDRTAEATNTTNLLTTFCEKTNQREISESTESINSILSNTVGFFEEVNTTISPLQESVTVTDMEQNTLVMPQSSRSYENKTAGDQYNSSSTSCQQFSANLRHSGDFAINLPSSEQFHVTSGNESENSGHLISSPSKFNKYFGRFILNYESLYLILGVMVMVLFPKSVPMNFAACFIEIGFTACIFRTLWPDDKLMLACSYSLVIGISFNACLYILSGATFKFASNLYSSYMFFDLFILVSTLVLILIPNKFNSEYIKYEYFKKYYKRVKFISCLVLSIFYIGYNIFLGHFVGFFPFLFDFQNILMLVLFVKNWNEMVKQKRCFRIYFVLLYFSMYLISIFAKAHLGSSIYLLRKI